jgi:hypothetical protein
MVVSKDAVIKKIKVYVPIIIVVLLLMKFSKAWFFIVIFSILAYQLKMIRGKFGLKLVVLDTLHFTAIMLAKYVGYKEAVLFVLFNTVIVDMVTFLASDGTFANFFLYSISTVVSVFFFGNNLLLCSVVAALMYSLGYYGYRVIVPSQAPFEVISKCITSLLFTFLYASFFGPLLGLIMSV